MPIDFNNIEIGRGYDRPFLARLWGYKNYQALSRGVFTPENTKTIVLFVTKSKQKALPQYNDYIDGNLLFWEGETQHGSDQRIIESSNKNDKIHLFYREIHHYPFVYFGIITLIEFHLRDNKPSDFIFKLDIFSVEIDALKEINEYETEYSVLTKTEQEQIIISRLGQGNFRRNVIHLWGSCSVTGLQNLTLLKASHIKPWKDSNNEERLNPYNGLLLIPDYDFLFDRGYLTFKNNGNVVISQRLNQFARKVFNVQDDLRLRNVFTDNKEFLEFHRSVVFK